MAEYPTPIEAVHDKLTAILAANRATRRRLDDDSVGPGELAAAWTSADETIAQALADGAFFRFADDGKPRSRYEPSEVRLQHAVDGLILMVNAMRSMRDGYIEGPDSEWKPSRQARERMRFLARSVLRSDAVWRSKHPGKEWLA